MDFHKIMLHQLLYFPILLGSSFLLIVEASNSDIIFKYLFSSTLQISHPTSGSGLKFLQVQAL